MSHSIWSYGNVINLNYKVKVRILRNIFSVIQLATEDSLLIYEPGNDNDIKIYREYISCVFMGGSH